MTTLIMIDWLSAFYKHIGSRSVILCMDNLQAHIAGVEALPPPSNIHVIWLPKNSTSIFQPLDQGIIQNLKIYYRKQWLQYIIQSIDNGVNPFTTVTLYETLHWCLDAWILQVSNNTIYRCFRKSTILEDTITLPSPPEPSLNHEYHTLQTRISDVMDLAYIINPEGENEVQEMDNTISMTDIINSHIGQELLEEEAILEDVTPNQGRYLQSHRRLRLFSF